MQINTVYTSALLLHTELMDINYKNGHGIGPWGTLTKVKL